MLLAQTVLLAAVMFSDDKGYRNLYIIIMALINWFYFNSCIQKSVLFSNLYGIITKENERNFLKLEGALITLESGVKYNFSLSIILLII